MTEQLKELQKEELKILKIFIKICKENKLKYFLVGGSAIGAMRHGGFIPWDDDIDVAMPREDYDKFMEIAQAKLPKHLFLQTTDTEKNYNLNFNKIRNSKTTFIEESNLKVDMNQGIFIDIFPLDGIGNESEEIKKSYRKYRVLHEKFRYKLGQQPKEGLRNKIRNIYYFLITSFDYLFKNIKTVKDYSKEVHKHCSSIKYSKSKYIINYCGAYGLRELSQRSIFASGREVKFEGIKVMVPKKVEKYLTDVYGDYMKLPPEEKRVAPHFHILDLEKSYKEYLNK